jgi:hypothetical protein
MQNLTLEFFLPYEGAAFGVAGSDSVVLRLAAVRPAGMPGFARKEAFSLIFEGPAQPNFGQGTLHLHNETAGGFDIFLVPVGANPGATQYEAVFN